MRVTRRASLPVDEEEEMDFIPPRYARQTSTVTFRNFLVNPSLERIQDGITDILSVYHETEGGVVDNPESQMQTGWPAHVRPLSLHGPN